MDYAALITSHVEQAFPLPASGSWPAAHHLLDEPSALALIAAIAARRPLLVRGEPGVGKSQLARAAAVLLERRFISAVIQPNTEYQELLWLFDHTHRLSDAQLAGAMKDPGLLKPADSYVAPGPLWYALNWQDASRKQNHQNYRPPADDHAPDPETHGVVLLIDEIDKADISVVNGLLEVLGNGRFDVQATGETVSATGMPPLVVLTSNDTRELPAAMVRRCVVLDLALPDGDALIEHLVAVGGTHFDELHEDIRRGAAKQIVEDRAHCSDLPRTGQAEYLDLLRALSDVVGDDSAKKLWLRRLARFFKKSHASGP